MVRNEWTNGDWTQTGFPLFRFPDFVFSGRWPVMREPLIRVILRYFEIFRVNLSSAFTIQHSKFTMISIAPLRYSIPLLSTTANHPNKGQ
jgi:hypothetical protein